MSYAAAGRASWLVGRADPARPEQQQGDRDGAVDERAGSG